MLNKNCKRPEIRRKLGKDNFLSFYYLKTELVDFCKQNGLPSTGNKAELTDRIAHYIETGKIESVVPVIKVKPEVATIRIDSKIEPNFVCSEKHREFFRKKIGNTFSFNVLFQAWLKTNTGKTYGDAIEAYYHILEDKKKNKSHINKQFEYNTYIRDYFADNEGSSLAEAIKCWKYKKSIKGHNRYESTDKEHIG